MLHSESLQTCCTTHKPDACACTHTSRCGTHIGWQFNAEDPDAVPARFWGLSRSSLAPSLIGKDTEDAQDTSDSDSDSQDTGEDEDESESDEGEELDSDARD
jgi:hypothetical protein